MTTYRLESPGREIAARAREIAREVAAPAAAAVDREARFPEEAVRALGEAGLWGLALSDECGGMNQPPRVFAAVVEELAQACASTAMVYVMHVAAGQAMAASKLPDRDPLLREIASGRHFTTLAFSERGSRSQFWAPVSKLQTNGQSYVTTASKSWVTSATRADSYVSSAQQPGTDSPLESTLYLVRQPRQRVHIAGRFDGLGLRGNDSAPVELKQLVVSQDDMLTENGAGATMMLEVVLPWFVVGTAALAHGLCLAAVDSTSRHLSNAGFSHTGEKLRDLPNLRARLAEMSSRTEQSRALLGFTVGMLEQPDEETPLWVLRSRLAAMNAAVDVTDLAMKACGGAAFSKHSPVERLFRDARAGWVMAPTVDHLHQFIGRLLTGLPLF